MSSLPAMGATSPPSPSRRRMIANVSGMARVLDADTVVVGMRPAVAITLVELGLTLEGVRTALSVEKGMALLEPAAD